MAPMRASSVTTDFAIDRMYRLSVRGTSPAPTWISRPEQIGKKRPGKIAAIQWGNAISSIGQPHDLMHPGSIVEYKKSFTEDGMDDADTPETDSRIMVSNPPGFSGLPPPGLGQSRGWLSSGMGTEDDDGSLTVPEVPLPVDSRNASSHYLDLSHLGAADLTFGDEIRGGAARNRLRVSISPPRISGDRVQSGHTVALTASLDSEHANLPQTAVPPSGIFPLTLQPALRKSAGSGALRSSQTAEDTEFTWFEAAPNLNEDDPKLESEDRRYSKVEHQAGACREQHTGSTSIESSPSQADAVSISSYYFKDHEFDEADVSKSDEDQAPSKDNHQAGGGREKQADGVKGSTSKETIASQPEPVLLGGERLPNENQIDLGDAEDSRSDSPLFKRDRKPGRLNYKRIVRQATERGAGRAA